MPTLRSRAAVTIAIAAALAGCATTGKYEQMLASWVGAPEVELIRVWGTPMRVYDSGGRRFMLFSDSRNISMPGVAPTYTTTFVGNTAYTNARGGVPAQNLGLWCNTTFEVQNERVVSWRWEGNDCATR